MRELSNGEIRELLGATLHGPLPKATIGRVFATLAEVPELRAGRAEAWQTLHARLAVPIPMLLWCPSCGERHLDVGEFATKPHHTHACQYCGVVWRPAVVHTVGVQHLPGYKNEQPRTLQAVEALGAALGSSTPRQYRRVLRSIRKARRA